jgi:hypothetical protein
MATETVHDDSTRKRIAIFAGVGVAAIAALFGASKLSSASSGSPANPPAATSGANQLAPTTTAPPSTLPSSGATRDPFAP